MFIRISDCCQCNSITVSFLSILLSNDSFKIALPNTGQNILKRKLVVFIEGNKESCVTDNSLFEFSNPPSHFAIRLYDFPTQISRHPFLQHRLVKGLKNPTVPNLYFSFSNKSSYHLMKYQKKVSTIVCN